MNRLVAEVRHLVVSLGYAIRPYDMVADRRRWRWQKPVRCNWSRGYGLQMLLAMTPEERARLVAHKRRIIGEDEETDPWLTV